MSNDLPEDPTDQHNPAAPATRPFTPSRLITGNYRLLVRDLYLYWHFARGYEQGIALTNRGLVPKPVLRMLDTRLRVPSGVEAARTEFEMERLYFLRHLLQQLELLTLRDGRLYAAEDRGFFAMPSLQRAHRCLQIWLNDRSWHDLIHLPNILIQPGPLPGEMAHPRLLEARRTLAHLLGQQEVGSWILVSSFANAARLTQPELFFPQGRSPGSDRYTAAGNPYGWDFRVRAVRSDREVHEFHVEAAAICWMLAGPLHWLGIVDLAWGSERPAWPEAFRLNPIGAALLLQSPETLAQVIDSPGKVLIQPDFTITAMEPVNESLLLQLDRFADRESLDRVATYRLTREVTGAAMQRGITAADILGVLRSWAEVPQNVAYTLQDWERQAGRIRFHPHTTLLEVAEPQILDRLMDNEALRRSLQRLGPTVALVAPEARAAVNDALVAAGELPLYSQPFSSDAAPERAWYMRDDGMLESRWPVPDRYLERELAPFVTFTDEGGMTLQPWLVRNAIAQGKSLEWLLEFLDQHIVGGLPAAWRLRLSAWGGRYRDTPRIHPGPLLMLRDARLLDELRADPAIGTLLGPTLPENTIVVPLDATSLATLRALLAERGITVAEADEDQPLR